MKVVVSGASGLIGSALVPALEADGHEVIRLVRRDPSGTNEIRWDPSAGELDVSAMQGVEAIVNLSGENLDRRWTEDAKREILESRTKSTRLLAAAAVEQRATTLVCAGGTGIYGDRQDEVLTEESSAPGGGFLAEVMEQTEASSAVARNAGVRVVHFRQGIVLSPEAGALQRMLPFFRFGVGGPVGSGKQWWSWVSVDDVISAYRFALDGDLAGPINLTAPNPVTSKQFAKALGSAINRPAVLPAPSFGIRLLFGQKGEEVLLYGQRVLPARLLESGFEFSDPQLDAALGRILSRG